MSKRVSISDGELMALNDLLSEVLNGYYSDASYENMDFEDASAENDYLMARIFLRSFYKKLNRQR